MKPLLIKIDDVVINLAHASIITKERPLGTRPGDWYSVKAGTSKHLMPAELFTRIQPSLLESGWVEIEVNQQEHLLNLAQVSEVSIEVMVAYGGNKKYTLHQGRGKDRVEILSAISPTDPLENFYFSAVSIPSIPLPAPAERRKYTIPGIDRFGRRRREVQVDISGERCG